MWVHRKPYKNRPNGGIPSAMQNLARNFPNSSLDVSKGGFWILNANGLRTMVRKFKSPLFSSYTNASGFHSRQGVWKAVSFDAQTGEEVKRDMLMDEAKSFIEAYGVRRDL